ncbi:hypothetical protein [Prosthecobacter vanneervenii]|uniref:Uncharacterized protein n=1 Tax=Prosthecobacter vanneervenii TaxID=48466 RepID=A0A7W7Y9Y2_9BACT|nr:hypothetical protein [Prosthecobacter vanneervenii]MBB5032338.1 hypothetical protein [Prosthecobacter vanneervenii]
MSEPENTPPTPPSGSTPKTAAVPLKKETVRITLRGRPGAGVTQPRESTSPIAPTTGGIPASFNTTSVVPMSAKKSTAPIQLPSAPLPPPAPKSSTAPVKLPAPPMSPPSKKTTSAIPVVSAPPPSAPAPTGAMPPPVARPLAPPTAPKPPGAPVAPAAPRPAGPPVAGLPAATRPLAQNPAAPPAPRMETGAPTVPLQKPTPGPRPAAPGAGTAPMASAGSAAPLPKATVKLQPTQAMQRPSVSAPPSAPVKRSAAADAEQFYEEKDPEAGLVPLSVICFVLSAILMFIQIMGADAVWTAEPKTESSLKVPESGKMAWEDQSKSGWQNNFSSRLMKIP